MRRFTKLESDIVCKSTVTEDEIASLECKRLEIEAEEPPKLYVLDAICHNELLIAEGRSLEDYSDIGLIQWALSDIGDWRPHTLRTRRQKDEEGRLRAEAKAKPATT